MASVKEIRTHIKSVQQTLKITNAMYLIASSNLRKARKQLAEVSPYFKKTTSTIADILHYSPDTHSPFFDTRPEIPSGQRKVGYVIITGDKGLAGAYNHNILRLAEEALAESPNATLFLIGQVGRSFFSHKDVRIDGDFLYTAQAPNLYKADEIGSTLVELFSSGQLDEVHIIYTEMVSSFHLEPRKYQLLPLSREAFPWQPHEQLHDKYLRTMSYFPSEEAVLNSLVPNYAKGIVFGTLVESFCSEQTARMTAMDASTKNAKEMLAELNLTLNRARQSAITQEITEIVSGAQAGL